MEFGLLAAAVASLAAAWVVVRATRPPEERRGLFDAMLTSAVIGLVAGRIGAMILAGTNPLARPLDLLIVRGGVDTVIASAAALGFLAWLSRRDPGAIADAISPAAVMALAVWHAGCVTGGTCLGTPSDLPWAWAASGGGVPRHPTEIYAALGLALGAAALLALRRRFSSHPGVLAAGGLAIAAAVRLATEPLRVTIDGGPWWWYAAGAVVGAALLVWRTTTAPTRQPGTR
jgi:prolipoprotein diacylglyceryltransferase